MMARTWIFRPLLLLLLGILAVAAVFAVRTALAEHNLQAAATPLATARLQAAVRYRPDDDQALCAIASRLMIGSPQEALSYAVRCVAANGAAWQNWRVLGLVQFELGNMAAARQAMLRESQASRGFDAHYQLANLAWLQGDMSLFWQQMRTAWRIAPYNYSTFLLNTAYRASGHEPGPILAVLPVNRPRVMGWTMGFFVLQHQLYDAAIETYQKLQCPPGRQVDCRADAVGLAGVLAEVAFTRANADSEYLASQAVQVWNSAVKQFGLVGPPLGAATRTLPFTADWNGPAFSWSRPSFDYVALAPVARGAAPAMRVRFDGTQPESIDITRQFLPVEAGRYRLRAQSGKVAGTHTEGLQLELRLRPGAALAVLPLSLAGSAQVDQLTFAVPKNTPLVEIEVAYQRPNGSVRMSGIGWISDIQLTRIGQ